MGILISVSQEALSPVSGCEFERKVPKPQFWTFVKAREVTLMCRMECGIHGKPNQRTLGSWESKGAALFSVTGSSSSAPGSCRAENNIFFIFPNHVQTLTCPNLFCGSCCPQLGYSSFLFSRLLENLAVPQLLPLDLINSSFL